MDSSLINKGKEKVRNPNDDNAPSEVSPCSTVIECEVVVHFLSVIGILPHAREACGKSCFRKSWFWALSSSHAHKKPNTSKARSLIPSIEAKSFLKYPWALHISGKQRSHADLLFASLTKKSLDLHSKTADVVSGGLTKIFGNVTHWWPCNIKQSPAVPP